MSHAILIPGRPSLQASVTTHADGSQTVDFTSRPIYRDAMSCIIIGHTPALTPAEYLAQLNAKIPAGEPQFIMVPWDKGMALIEKAQDAHYIRPWEEIDREKHDYYLGVLPPEKWRTVDGVSIFRMCEYLTSNITQHCAAIGGRYFAGTFRTDSPSYEEHAAAVRALAESTLPKSSTHETVTA